MKDQLVYICSRCDTQHPKWVGRCSECGNWGTVTAQSSAKKKTEPNSALAASAKTLSDIDSEYREKYRTGIREFDRVLGGGITPGSVVLVGGEPGIGKSTLILQVAHALKRNVMYVSGEESAGQIKGRLDRIRISGDRILFINDTDIQTICATLIKEKPALAIIDSIQTVFSSDIPSEAGSVSQIRSATVSLLEVAKKNNIAVFIVGHITKEGAVAGPKTLEHLVDTVIYLEGDRYHSYRLLRTMKNRFGSTQELGIFEMTELGLKEITNPSAIFLEDRGTLPSGSVICPVVEGSRVFLAEIQALVTKSGFGYPQRKSLGLDVNRLNLLIAVLQKRLKLPLEQYDIFINVAGGLKISEPASDLAVCLAILSAFQGVTAPEKSICFGEVGLGGEVRQVTFLDKRIFEAEKLGFNVALIPRIKKDANKYSCQIRSISLISDLAEELKAPKR